MKNDPSDYNSAPDITRHIHHPHASLTPIHTSSHHHECRRACIFQRLWRFFGTKNVHLPLPLFIIIFPLLHNPTVIRVVIENPHHACLAARLLPYSIYTLYDASGPCRSHFNMLLDGELGTSYFGMLRGPGWRLTIRQQKTC